MDRSPIGLFDSGFGGLTVLREVVKALPFEDVIYLGDTANLPYGNKSPEKIRQLALENGKFLLTQGIKLLVVACHTACSHALNLLAQELPIPVLGVIEPGLEELKMATHCQRVAILGTSSTIASGTYQNRLPNLAVLGVACPLFVPLVEEGFQNTQAAELIAREYLKPVQAHGSDAILLACTHYPLMRPVLSKILGTQVTLIEPAKRCAQEVKSLLAVKKLLNPPNTPAKRAFYTTDAPEKFRTLGSVFLGEPIHRIELKKTALPGMIFTDRGGRHESQKENLTC